MRHQTISFIKSGIRIVAGIVGAAFLFLPVDPFPFWGISAGFLGLTLAEFVGIWEEVGHD